jgi:alkenylglycerophosphocholine/alkenylglycerophosphoethanolamine hydrolase
VAAVGVVVNGAAFLLLALGLVAAAVDWIAVQSGHKRVEYIAKPATLAFFVASAATLDPVDPTVRSWFVAALVLSLIGDVFLMFEEKFFVYGLASFLLGHVAYIVGMNIDGLHIDKAGVGLVLVAIGAGTIGIVIIRAVGASAEPELLVPVAVYMGVISLMVVCAFGTWQLTAVAGATLFYASDALIAWNKFVRAQPHGRLAIIVTYHLAQAGLLLSLV